MKKSDLTAYLDGELDASGITEVERVLVERQELLDDLSELCVLRFLLAEHYHKQQQSSSTTETRPSETNIGDESSEPQEEADGADSTSATAFPTEPPPVEVARPRRARSGPAPFVVAAAASLTALLVLNSLEIGGWTRSSRAVVETGFVTRYGQITPIDHKRVLYFDDYLTTRDESAPVIYSDTDTTITLGPWSKARFHADLNTKHIELVEGTLTVAVTPPPPAPRFLPAPPPKEANKQQEPGWKQTVIDTIEPWLNPRKVTNPEQLVISSTAGRIDIPQDHTDRIEFSFSIIDRTFELNHRNGAINLTTITDEHRRVVGRQLLRSGGDGKVQKIGNVKSKARIQFSDANTAADLAACASVRPNEKVGLTFRKARPITAQFNMGRPVTAVHFFLAHKAPGAEKFTDLNADSFRPKGKVTSNKPPFLFFGEHGGNAADRSSWKPHKSGVYRLTAVPVLPKQSKPNWKESVVVYLEYK